MIRFRPPRIAAAYFLVGVGVDLVLPIEIPVPVWGKVVAAAAFLGGLSLMLWAWWLFERAGAPIRPTDVPTTLVDRGPYRLSRNPMYVAAAFIMLGPGVFLGSIPIVLAVVAFVATMERVHIPFEEAAMERALGDRYRQYRTAVRRWL